MLAVCKHGLSNRYRHFFYGGTNHVLGELETRLRSQFPNLTIAGSFAPPCRPLSLGEEDELKMLMATLAPDIMWIGIGSPKQERWMADHVGRLDVPVMIGVGAAFDFLSGSKPQAPRWMRQSGLEWLFRLATEPRRLWRRYAEYPIFLALLLAQLTGIRKFEIKD